MLTRAEVAKHSTVDDLWVIIAGQAYDLTAFAPEHPGGLKSLLRWAGRDATEEYWPIHPEGTIDQLSKEHQLGPVEESTAEKEVVDVVATKRDQLPTLAGCLNLDDFERAAEIMLKPKAWAYYASAADDEQTKDWNQSSFSHIRLRPRVLRDVTVTDLSTTILGHKSSLPIFITPCAMGRLAHPDGEKCLARQSAAAGIPYIVSANASVGFEELARDTPNHTLFYQVYVNKDRAKTEAQLRRVAKAGYKGICVTVDAPVAGKRERDERCQLDADSASDPSMRNAVVGKPSAQGISQSLGSYVDSALTWSDLAWISRVTDGLPLMVKGIATAEDAAIAASMGVKAIYLSNHGGRQLEGAPSSIETLLEIRKYEPQVFEQCEVFVDGGVRRGTDIIKALALGATAVGIGRPYMYSLVFGDEGVAKVTGIIRAELEQNLRLVGATKLSDLSPSVVNTSRLDALTYVGEYVSPIKTSRAKL